MNLLANLRCMMQASCNPKTFYTQLSTQELRQRKAALQKNVFIAMVLWGAALLLLLFLSVTDTASLLLEAGAVTATMVAIWYDHQNQKQLIEDLLA